VITPRRRWYRGVHFRSTLEADWAATLDSLGITWQYEPEAYQTPEGVYSPDFWIPAQKVWLEVKGPHGDRTDKAEAFANLLAVAHEQYCNTMDLSWNGRYSLPNLSSDHAVLVYGLPSEGGMAIVRPASCFSTVAAFARCPRCHHWLIDFPDRWGFICSICGHEVEGGDDEHLYQSVAFVRARTDKAG
jgi:hypothetical protein